jgi:hypothetical protein
MWIIWLEKKILKTIGILLGIVVVLVTALHIFVVNNAEKLIEELVSSRSNNKLKLRVENIKFNYFSRKVELQRVHFFSNDSLDLKTSYVFDVDNIKLRVKALLPIFTRKELLIDSLYLRAPRIEVTRLKPSDSSARKDVSIPEEMGKIYNSIIDALKLFQVTRFEMNDGVFTLKNKILPDQVPLTISNLHIHIDNFRIDTALQNKNLFLSDQMVFRTRNQDIIFPDGRHRLAFSRFRINIRRKLIEIDSCTLSGKRRINGRSGFTIFLDTLKLVNVDFKALYEKELIKADSVFCQNPDFKIEFALKENVKARKKLPGIDSFIQQMTGDLLLHYIGVLNAGINITTYQGEKATSFTSKHNNFEMTGLSIDQSKARPVSLESFDMAIRNYENFLKDSSYFLRFDSILLRENRILLSNFSVNTEPYKDTRNIKVRRFALGGLSWSDLLFNRRIVAQQAILYQPDIDYTQPENRLNKSNKKGILSSLDAIDKIMDLEKIQIVDGMLKIKTQRETEVQLQHTNLLLNSHSLVKAPTASHIERAIELLDFGKGVLKTKNMIAYLDQVAYDGEVNRLKLGKINLHHRDQRFNISASQVLLDHLDFDDSLNFFKTDSLRWSKAEIEFNTLSGEKTNSSLPAFISLNNISGANTVLHINSEIKSLSVFLETFSASMIEKQDTLVTAGVKMTGHDLNYFTTGAELAAASFQLNDQAASAFRSLRIKLNSEESNTRMYVPEILFTADLNRTITGKPYFKQVQLIKPEINSNILRKHNPTEHKAWPDITVDSLLIENPVLKTESPSSGKISILNWNGSENRLLATHLVSSSKNHQIGMATLSAGISNFWLTDSLGKTIRSRNITATASMENVVLQKTDRMNWSGRLLELTVRNFKSDSLGGTPVSIGLDSVTVHNFLLNSAWTNNLKDLIKNNTAFTVKQSSGIWKNEKTIVQWKNFYYDKAAQRLSLDSFSFVPVLSRDAFVAASPFQTDYMTLHTASVRMTQFDLDQYLADSIFRMGDLQISRPVFTSYRDKRPPFNAGIIKPLPSKLIQKIPLKLSVDTIKIQDGRVVYTELNDKTNETGVVPVTRISGDVFPIRNINLNKQDTLRIRLNGYLLDTAWIRLRTRESYADSQSGFLITLRMRPGSLLYLNEILEPLASIKLQSGYLDTLVMRAVGKDHLSLGEMRMFYHGLKIQFLRNGTEAKKRFLTGLMTFIANSFVIKRENSKKTGVVYFPRLRDRSFINYYIKIAMSGVASSVGAKKNKKLLRQYRKEIKLRQLPPIEFD